MHLANGIPLGCSLLLPVITVNSIQTLKVTSDKTVLQVEVTIPASGSITITE
jgi:hypothetical protein